MNFVIIVSSRLCLFHSDGVVSSLGIHLADFSNSVLHLWWWKSAGLSNGWKPLVKHENPGGESSFSGPRNNSNTFIDQLVYFRNLTLLHLHYYQTRTFPKYWKPNLHDRVHEEGNRDPSESRLTVSVSGVLSGRFQHDWGKPARCGKHGHQHFWEQDTN